MAAPTIADAGAAYLAGAELAHSSRRACGVSLGRMARELGPARLLSELLREKTLWRLLYETAARAEEVLALDAEELNLPTAAPVWSLLEYVRGR